MAKLVKFAKQMLCELLPFFFHRVVYYILHPDKFIVLSTGLHKQGL